MYTLCRTQSNMVILRNCRTIPVERSISSGSQSLCAQLLYFPITESLCTFVNSQIAEGLIYYADNYNEAILNCQVGTLTDKWVTLTQSTFSLFRLRRTWSMTQYRTRASLVLRLNAEISPPAIHSHLDLRAVHIKLLFHFLINKNALKTFLSLRVRPNPA